VRPEHTSGRYEQRAPRAYAVFSPVFRRRRTVTHAKPIPVNTPTNTQYIGTSPWVTTTIAIVMPGCGPAPPCATTVHQRTNPVPRPDRSAIQLANLAFSPRRKHRLRYQARPGIHGNAKAAKTAEVRRDGRPASCSFVGFVTSWFRRAAAVRLKPATTGMPLRSLRSLRFGARVGRGYRRNVGGLRWCVACS